MRAVVGVANPLTVRLLGAGAAGPVARSLLVLEFTGRRSGRVRRTPVGYARDGSTVLIPTHRSYRWWKNTVAGAKVRLRLPEGWRDAWAEAIDPLDPRYLELVKTYADLRGPGILRAFGLDVDEHGRPHGDPTYGGLVMVLCLLEGDAVL
jgi:hypothetical protein